MLRSKGAKRTLFQAVQEEDYGAATQEPSQQSLNSNFFMR